MQDKNNQYTKLITAIIIVIILTVIVSVINLLI